jgi:hypothetical protein
MFDMDSVIVNHGFPHAKGLMGDFRCLLLDVGWNGFAEFL